MTKYFTKEGDDYKEVTEELLTQERVDGIVKDRGERYAKQNFSDYDDLKAKAGQADAQKEEYEGKLSTLGKEKSELEKKLTGATLETEKVKIVSEFGLSDELSEFVSGENADEMRERAEKLAKGMKPNKVVIDKQKKSDGGKPTDSKTIAGKLFGNKSDD